MIKWEFQQKHKDPRMVQGVMVHGLLEESPDISNTLTAGYILKTDSLLKKHGIPLYLTAVPSRYRSFTGDTSFISFSARMQRWAITNGLRFVSSDSAFTAAATAGARLFYNIDVHYNAAGHRVQASVFENAVAGVLTQFK